MYRILYCLVVFSLVLVIRKIFKILHMRKEFKNVQKYIDEFNYAYEQCEFIIAKDIVFSESEDELIKEKIDENGIFRIDLFDESFFKSTCSYDARKFLLSMGKYILLCEEELRLKYGEIEYDQTYSKFQQNYRNLRICAYSFGDKIS